MLTIIWLYIYSYLWWCCSNSQFNINNNFFLKSFQPIDPTWFTWVGLGQIFFNPPMSWKNLSTWPNPTHTEVFRCLVTYIHHFIPFRQFATNANYMQCQPSSNLLFIDFEKKKKNLKPQIISQLLCHCFHVTKYKCR